MLLVPRLAELAALCAEAVLHADIKGARVVLDGGVIEPRARCEGMYVRGCAAWVCMDCAVCGQTVRGTPHAGREESGTFVSSLPRWVCWRRAARVVSVCAGTSARPVAGVFVSRVGFTFSPLGTLSESLSGLEYPRTDCVCMCVGVCCSASTRILHARAKVRLHSMGRSIVETQIVS